MRAAVDSLDLCDLAAADVAIAGHEQLGQALGHPRWKWRSALLRSMRAQIEGRWADSEAARRRAAELAAQSDDPNAVITMSIHALGTLRAQEAGAPGDVTAAWHLSLDSFEYAALGGPAMRGSLLARFGDLDAAVRLLAARRLDTTIATDPLLLSSLTAR